MRFGLDVAQHQLSQPWDDVRSSVKTLSEAGWSNPTVGWPTEEKAHLDEFAEHVMPDYGD